MSDKTTTGAPCVTPLADLRAAALQHYEALALHACSFSSVIPRAINAYFDAEEAKAAAIAGDTPISGDRA